MPRITTSSAAALALALATAGAQAQTFRLESTDLRAGRAVPDKHVYKGFGCSGANLSPALNWRNPPSGTKSFALLMHDPDAPTGGAGWWHWAVVNIPADASALAQGAGSADGPAKLPAGSQQVNTDFGAPGYGGPCPPPGDKPHRYNFMLHALKVEKLELPANATASLAGYMVNANSLAKATLTARYRRAK